MKWRGPIYLSLAAGSLFFFMQPIAGSTLGFFLLGEKLHWNFFLGAFFIAAGIFISTREYPRSYRAVVQKQTDR